MVKKITGSQKLPPRKHLPAMALVVMMLCSSLPLDITLASPSTSGKNLKAIAQTVPEKQNSYTLNLKQLGVLNSIDLVGVDARNFIDFNVRADEVISQAIFSMRYKYSPDLVSNLSQINVYLNGEVIKSIETPKVDGNKDLEILISIPPELFSETNQLTFQLIGHYSSGCEDPKSSKLWATISNSSSIKLSAIPLVLPNDLANLPMPFASKNNSRKLYLPFVFMDSPSNASLEAAGILSSWFGVNSSQTGSQFPVTISNIPETGNAIIFIDPSANLTSINLPKISGPMIFIAGNPKDPYGKLLFVAGRNGREIKQAALAIALGSQNLLGQIAFITPTALLPSRKPYDAPNWLSENGPIKLSALTSNPMMLNASGIEQAPIALKVQFPPALYDSKNKGIPLNLDYIYTNQFQKLDSRLTIDYKNQLVKSIPLPMRNEWLSHLDFGDGFLARILGLTKNTDNLLSNQTTVHIPMAVAYPNLKIKPKPLLQLSFAINQSHKIGSQLSDCPSSLIKENIQASISPNSTINISGLQHFLEMPNLSAFSDSGFPFSRLADLSETAVVLPDTPNTNDYSAYLALVAHIGNLTGYPGISLTVTSASNLDAAKDKDLLVITSGNGNQSILTRWEKIIPSEYRRDFKLSTMVNDIRTWFSLSSKFDIYKNTYIAGFESPLKNGRSVVLFSSNDPEKLNDLTDALDGSLGSIAGSLTSLNDEHMHVIADKQTYYNGSLSWLSYIPWLISRYLALFLIISTFTTILLSLLIYASLKAKKRQRLQS